jgi:hypothetical protein
MRYLIGDILFTILAIVLILDGLLHNDQSKVTLGFVFFAISELYAIQHKMVVA